MNRRYLALFVMLGLILGAAVGVGSATQAQAAPVGAADGQYVLSQSCQSNGLVSVRFVWNPSGYGDQWVDVSGTPNFAGWANAGPLPAGQNFIDWTNLNPNTTYYSRIATWGGAWLISDAISFATGNCAGSFSPPHNLRDSELSGGGVRFGWDAGANNYWYCLDVAMSEADLIGLRGSWRNYGCGTTATSLDITGLPCGQRLYWRVWAVGPGTSGHSAVETVTIETCDFRAPTNLRSEALSPTSIRFRFDRGVDNTWFCVDTATSEADLLAFTGSYRPHGCGTTGTTIDGTGLTCNTRYYWRVFAQGERSSGHSAVATVDTPACGFTPPHTLTTEGVGKTDVNFDWERGVDNLSFCVDTAQTQDDLLFFTGTWENFGCGTTSTALGVTGLTCNTTYYWRVYAVGSTVSGHSVIAQFTTDAC